MSNFLYAVVGVIISALMLQANPFVAPVLIFLFTAALPIGGIAYWFKAALPSDRAKVIGDRQDEFRSILDEYDCSKGTLQVTSEPTTRLFGTINSNWKGNDLIITPDVLQLSKTQFRALVVGEIFVRKGHTLVRVLAPQALRFFVVLGLQIAAAIVMGGEFTLLQAFVLATVTAIVSKAMVVSSTRYAEVLQDQIDDIVAVECGSGLLELIQARRATTATDALGKTIRKTQTRRIERLEELQAAENSTSS